MKFLRTTLTVCGPKHDVARFKEAARATGKKTGWPTDLSLEALAPVPDLGQEDARQTAYRLRENHSGTPWDVRASCLIGDSETQLDYEFKSASSPPLAWLALASAQFPSLEFFLEYEDSQGDGQGSAWARR